MELKKRDGELHISKIFMREIDIIDQNYKHAVFDLTICPPYTFFKLFKKHFINLREIESVHTSRGEGQREKEKQSSH